MKTLIAVLIFSVSSAFTAGSAKVELCDTVDKISIRHKEGVHFGFAFNVPDARIRMDIPWGVMDPVHDMLPGANKNWIAMQRFMDFSSDKAGVTWCPIEAPVIELGTMSATILGSALRSSEGWRREIKPTQTVFSWALNNHWHTNFPLEQGGVIPFHYAILPHGAYDPAAVNRFALAERRPLVCVRTAGAPKIATPVAIDNPRVFLSTAKPAADGSGAMVLRLRSISDREENVVLSFPGGAPGSLRYCGGDEIPGETVSTPLTLLPFGCVSLRLEKP
jgi:alpha-mannosidase